MHLYKRNFKEAIAILLQSRPPFTYRAIKILIQASEWETALETAMGSKQQDEFVDIVLWYRVNHLRQMERRESSVRFQSLLQQSSLLSKQELSELKSKLRITE